MPTDIVNRNVGDTGRRVSLHVHMTLGDRIRAARKRAKLTQQQVADKLGISRVSVTQWESDRTRPEYRNLVALAGLVGVPPGHLLAGKGGEEIERNLPEPEPPPALSGPVVRPPGMSRLVEAPAFSDERLPVLGVGRGGDDGRFAFNGDAVEYIARPPNLIGVRHAYAIYVVGDSMTPRYRPGEIVWVNPNKPPTRFDDVVVQIHTNDPDAPPEGLIKEFRAWTPGKLQLWQHNPAQDLYFERGIIKSVHVIVGSLRN